jgi:hypothetical protein
MENAPWWKSSTVAAVIGLAIPAATFVQGWLQKSRELELQDRQQKQELRLAYMNVLVEGGLDGMVLVADFVSRTEPDPSIKIWAADLKKGAEQHAAAERTHLEDELKKLRAAEAEQQKAQAEARSAQASVEVARERAAAGGGANNAAKVALEAADAKREVALKTALEKEQAVRAVEERVDKSKATLEGRLGTPASTRVLKADLVAPMVQRTLSSLKPAAEDTP